MITTSYVKFMRAVLVSENIFKTTPSKIPLNIFQICQNMHFSAQKRDMNIQPWKVADANRKEIIHKKAPMAYDKQEL